MGKCYSSSCTVWISDLHVGTTEYVCVYVCMYACKHEGTCMYVCVCIYVYMYDCVYINIVIGITL